MLIALLTFSCPVPCGAMVMFALEDPVAIVVPLPPVPVVSDSKSLPVPTWKLDATTVPVPCGVSVISWLDESVAIVPVSPSIDKLSITTLPVPCGLKLIFALDDVVEIKLSASVRLFDPCVSMFATIVAPEVSTTDVTFIIFPL